MSVIRSTDVDQLIADVAAGRRPTPLRPPLLGRPPEDDALAALFKMHAQLNRLELAIEEHRISTELLLALQGAAIKALEARLRVVEGKE